MEKVGVGLVGSGFAAEIHSYAPKQVPDAEIVAVASSTEGHAKKFAEAHRIPHWFKDYRKILEMEEVGLVVIGIPNDLHCEVAVESARAGKHIVCEKPLCLNLTEAEPMIKTAKEH